MNKTILNWAYVIKNCSVENTYKMSWSKSIIECCVTAKDSSAISFNDISHNMFKYYWNQMMFIQPNLQQSSNPAKSPRFLSYVKDKIEEYKNTYGNRPIKFERVEQFVKIKYSHLNSILKKDVCFRLLKIGNEFVNLYDLDIKNSKIIVHDINSVKEYSDILFELINYRWTQILESFNSSPRISKKIKITDRDGIRRSSLEKFHKYLSLTDTVCFICNKELKEDISVDHLIPWSYMFSDDIWNLVFTHQGCNSSKSNRIIRESEVNKLEKRNKSLLKKLEENEIKDKHFEELKFAIQNNLLRKFWIGFK